MYSFGIKAQWEDGVDAEQLFERACFLSDLIKGEDYLKNRIQKSNKDFFE